MPGIFVRLQRLLFTLLLFTESGLSAQITDRWKPVDSVRLALQNRPGFRLGLDGRRSFLNGEKVQVTGYRYGFDFGKIALFTGLYGTQLALNSEKDTARIGFTYMSSTLEYYLYQSWRFEIVNSYQLGIGNGFDYLKTGDEIKRNYQGLIVPVETGIGGTVRFLRYFGFSAGLGIRMSLVNGTGFSGSYYYYGLTLFPGTAYRDLKKAFR